MKNIILFTNILTPYRISFYDKLNEYFREKKFEFKVLVMSRSESNRHWNYEDYERDYTVLLRGKQIKVLGYVLNFNPDLPSVINKLSPSIVLAAGSYIHPSFWMLIKICQSQKTPLFFWSESHINTERCYGKIKIYIREKIRSIIYKKMDGFLYAGKLSKEFIVKYCNDNAKFIFLPNLIDDNFYGKKILSNNECRKLKNSYNVDEKTKIFLCPARLSTDKGIMPFLELLSGVSTVVKYKIIIAGDGEQRKQIEQFIDENRLNVQLVGYKGQKEMRELYQIADGFILPSIVDPNPLTCIEALWSGLPLLVSSHVGNYPEVVCESNGMVFSYDDDYQARKIIKRFIEQNDEWYSVAQKTSIELAQNRYNSVHETKRVCEEIIKCIK